jgi:hypothetical protein
MRLKKDLDLLDNKKWFNVLFVLKYANVWKIGGYKLFLIVKDAIT